MPRPLRGADVGLEPRRRPPLHGIRGFPMTARAPTAGGARRHRVDGGRMPFTGRPKRARSTACSQPARWSPRQPSSSPAGCTATSTPTRTRWSPPSPRCRWARLAASESGNLRKNRRSRICKCVKNGPASRTVNPDTQRVPGEASTRPCRRNTATNCPSASVLAHTAISPRLDAGDHRDRRATGRRRMRHETVDRHGTRSYPTAGPDREHIVPATAARPTSGSGWR